jgi:hypothetical protein
MTHNSNVEDNMKITIWRRIYHGDNALIVEHNHIEDGHIAGIVPKGHKSWSAYQWIKSFGFLINSKVIK